MINDLIFAMLIFRLSGWSTVFFYTLVSGHRCDLSSIQTETLIKLVSIIEVSKK